MDHKPANTPEGVLVRIQNKLLLTLGIDANTLKILIDRFVTNTIRFSGTKSHFAKTNIYNELSKDKMTIKVFFKFLKILTIKHVKITVTVTTSRDKVYTVEENIDLFATLGDDDGD